MALKLILEEDKTTIAESTDIEALGREMELSTFKQTPLVNIRMVQILLEKVCEE